MTWTIFEEHECPKCHSENIEEVDNIDLGAFVLIHYPFWGADYKCKDCEHEWSSKLI